MIILNIKVGAYCFYFSALESAAVGQEHISTTGVIDIGGRVETIFDLIYDEQESPTGFLEDPFDCEGGRPDFKAVRAMLKKHNFRRLKSSRPGNSPVLYKSVATCRESGICIIDINLPYSDGLETDPAKLLNYFSNN